MSRKNTVMSNIDTRSIYSVSELNRDVKALLGNAFPLMWIQGEISNLAIPASGHWYFTLKDPKAQIRGAMFKQRNRYLKIKPSNGMEVLVRARVSLYEPRGDYQLIVEDMEEAGAGALQRAFEALKVKLQGEGLFDPAHKKALPERPRHIGVITSPTGAAIRDILSVLKRRAPDIPVTIYPVPVQGEDAANKIASMIAKVNARKECDAIILSRGGGSLEDLWSFNEEIVARAVFASEIPLISGVGHEIDFTIADFVADHRAPTPSAAAEMLAPDHSELMNRLRVAENRLLATTQSLLRQTARTLELTRKRLIHPQQTLMDHAQRLDELELRLQQGVSRLTEQRQLRLATLLARVERHDPKIILNQLQQRHSTLSKQLMSSMKQFLHNRNTALGNMAHALNTVSPLATLDRGYAIVTRVEDGALVRNAADVDVGQKLQTRVGKGTITSTVEDRHLE